MEKLALNCIKRTWEEKLKTLRESQKKIPAVIYWHNFAPVSVALDYSDFLKTFRISWQTHIIKLSIDWKNQDVLVHDVQYHPVTWDFQHIDFIIVNAKEKIHVNIPLKLIGNAPALKEWWLVDQLVDEIEVKCFPADLVDHFEFDISNMKEIWQVAHLSELKLDLKKYETHMDLETPMVSILEQKWQTAEESTVSPSEVPSAQDDNKTE